MNVNNKKVLFLFLKISFAVVMLVVIIKDVKFGEITNAIHQPRNIFLLYLGAILLIPNLYVQWLRWHYLIKLIKSDVSAKDTLTSYLSGMAAGFVTPGRVGEISRSIFLPNVDRVQSVGMTIIEKAYAFVPIIAVGIWGIVFVVIHSVSSNVFLSLPLVIVAAAVSFTIVLFFNKPLWIRTLIYNLSLIFPYRDKMKKLYSCFDLLQKKNAETMLLLSFLLYLIYIAQFILFAHAFQAMSFITSLASTVTTMFVKTLLPVSFADLGIREGAAVYFFSLFNVSKAAAFNSSILLFTVNILLPSITGLIIIIFSRINLSKKNN